MRKTKKQWQSKIGFILASSGAAIGLGNLQRFPYLVSKQGGGAFLFVYLLCVLAIGIPLMLSEFCLGRYYQKNPSIALKEACSNHRLLKHLGILPILTAFFILSYYIVLSGWTLGFSLHFLLDSSTTFASITTSAPKSLLYTGLFYCITGYIVTRGINQGIERSSLIFMPLLLIMLVFLAITSVSLPNSTEGLYFYLAPDFSKINSEMILYALGQAFFSLCIGEGVLMTYGSYANKSENLVQSTFSIAFFDTFVAFLSGFIIFPALFSFGYSTDQNSELIFQVMPRIFQKLYLGIYLQIAFFLCLCFAALTTCISLLEVVVNYLTERYKLKRRHALLATVSCSFVISTPIALSKGAVSLLSHLKLPFLKLEGLYEIVDIIWGNFFMLISGLVTAIFCGWLMGSKKAIMEINEGAPGFLRWSFVWIFSLRFVCSLSIICLILGLWM